MVFNLFLQEVSEDELLTSSKMSNEFPWPLPVSRIDEWWDTQICNGDFVPNGKLSGRFFQKSFKSSQSVDNELFGELEQYVWKLTQLKLIAPVRQVQPLSCSEFEELSNYGEAGFRRSHEERWLWLELFWQGLMEEVGVPGGFRQGIR